MLAERPLRGKEATSCPEPDPNGRHGWIINHTYARHAWLPCGDVSFSIEIMGYKGANEHGRTSGSSKDCSSEIIGHLFSSSLKVANFGTVEPARALLLLKLAGMVGLKAVQQAMLRHRLCFEKAARHDGSGGLFVLGRRADARRASNKQRYGSRPADEAYFVKWIVTQPFLQIVRTCLSRWPL